MYIINDTIENLEICKSYYADIYTNVGCSFQNYLNNAPDVLIKQIEDDLILNLYSSKKIFFDLKNKPNTKEVLQIFDRFFLLLVDF